MFRHVLGRICFLWGAGGYHFTPKEEKKSSLTVPYNPVSTASALVLGLFQVVLQQSKGLQDPFCLGPSAND